MTHQGNVIVISCTYERPQIAKYARQSKTFNKSLK